MRIVRRDLIFAAIILSILFALIVNSIRKKATRIPRDKKHHTLVALVEKGGNREEVEKVCATCHNSRFTSLSLKHPPKERCLLCHHE